MESWRRRTFSFFWRQKDLHVAWLPIRAHEKGSLTHTHTHTGKSVNLKPFMRWILNVVKYQRRAAEQKQSFFLCFLSEKFYLKFIFFSSHRKHLNNLKPKQVFKLNYFKKRVNIFWNISVLISRMERSEPDLGCPSSFLGTVQDHSERNPSLMKKINGSGLMWDYHCSLTGDGCCWIRFYTRD